MKFLLDTAAFLFAATDDPRFSLSSRAILDDPGHRVFLSAASAWEIGLKHARGKLLLPEPPDRYVPRIRQEMGIETVPVGEETALRAGRLPDLHRDPFDRLLVSQAISMGMTILTPDEAIRQYPVPTVW